MLILTVSQRPTDVKLAYEKGAASFVVKPFIYEQWPAYLANLRRYWLKTVSVPAIIPQANQLVLACCWLPNKKQTNKVSLLSASIHTIKGSSRPLIVVG